MNKNNLPENQSNFILYTGNEGDVNVEVFLQDENIWPTQKAMGELFGKERSVITKHIKNIFSSGELEEKSNVQNMHFGHSDPTFRNFQIAKVRIYSALVIHPGSILQVALQPT